MKTISRAQIEKLKRDIHRPGVSSKLRAQYVELRRGLIEYHWAIGERPSDSNKSILGMLWPEECTDLAARRGVSYTVASTRLCSELQRQHV